MPYCIKCGAQIAEDDRFCTACGAQQFAEKESPAYEPPKAEYVPPVTRQDGYAPYGGQPTGAAVPGGGQTGYAGAAVSGPAQDYGAAPSGGAVRWEPEVSPKKASMGPAIAVMAVVIILVLLLFIIVVSLVGRADDRANTPVDGSPRAADTAVDNSEDTDDMATVETGSTTRELAEDIVILVQGNIDSLYLGRADRVYYDVVGATVAECEEDYLRGLEKEAEFFADYCSIEFLPDDLKADLVELYKEIYSFSRYTVGEARRKTTDTYEVKVEIYPLNIMQLLLDGIDEGGMDWYYDKYPNGSGSMTDAEYEQYDRDWADGLIAIVREQLSKVGYEDPQTLAVQVIRDADGYWIISDESMSDIDALIIDY